MQLDGLNGFKNSVCGGHLESHAVWMLQLMAPLPAVPAGNVIDGARSSDASDYCTFKGCIRRGEPAWIRPVGELFVAHTVFLCYSVTVDVGRPMRLTSHLLTGRRIMAVSLPRQ